MENEIKGILGLLGIWLAWLIGHLSEIKEGAQILASVSAIIASFFYARYYWNKTRREKSRKK
jgi:membrane protein DedA with SNARE-associated domain